MSWSPMQYLVFEDDRTRPVRDLLAAIPPVDARAVVDIGCGPGNSTELLAARYPGAVTTGLDSSPDMVAAACRRLPCVGFEVTDISAWGGPGPFDVILGNAVLQWVPDHPAVLTRLLGLLRPGGSVAMQLPDNLEEPAYQAMRAVAAEEPWAGTLRAAAGFRAEQHMAADYYRMLRPGCSRVDVWTTTYQHVLPGGAAAVVEWFKGSGLRPYLAPLDAAQRDGFLDRYSERIEAAYPAQPDGAVLLAFPRLFFVGTR